MTSQDILSGDAPKWLFAFGLALLVLVIMVGQTSGGLSSPFQRAPQVPTYTVTAQIPVGFSINPLGRITGTAWGIEELQDLRIEPERGFLGLPFFLGGGFLSTGEVRLRACIANKCDEADLGSFSKLGEDKIALVKIRGVEAGAHTLTATLNEEGVTKTRKSYSIMVG